MLQLRALLRSCDKRASNTIQIYGTSWADQEYC